MCLRYLLSNHGTPLATLSGHTSWVLSVSYSPSSNGDRVVSSSADHTVKVWDVSANAKQCVHTFTDHADQVWGVCYNPDGDKVASVAEDKTINIFDIPV